LSSRTSTPAARAASWRNRTNFSFSKWYATFGCSAGPPRGDRSNALSRAMRAE
jgi:hypothetical protein